MLERFFLNLKTERVWQRRYANRNEAIADTTHRLHSTLLGYRPPADYEKAAI